MGRGSLIVPVSALTHSLPVLLVLLPPPSSTPVLLLDPEPDPRPRLDPAASAQCSPHPSCHSSPPLLFLAISPSPLSLPPLPPRQSQRMTVSTVWFCSTFLPVKGKFSSPLSHGFNGLLSVEFCCFFFFFFITLLLLLFKTLLIANCGFWVS